jgi:Fur family transcriptional regulator, iron response regulator
VMDIPPTNLLVGNTPTPPEGYEIVRIDIVVRLRRKQAWRERELRDRTS